MKIASIVLVIIGIALLVVSLFADFVGIGDSAGFGRQQTAGTIAGAAAAALGLFLMLRKKKRSNREP
jgi:LPXTG-motif cell wall-anchored protein